MADARDGVPSRAGSASGTSRRRPLWRLGRGQFDMVAPWEPQAETAMVERAALPLPDKPSIAVLPFDSFGSDAEQAYFADGISEDLITDLSKLSGIFVIARNSSWTYKGKPTKVQKVAAELGVRYVLEGSVRRQGDQVRINAQLIDAHQRPSPVGGAL